MLTIQLAQTCDLIVNSSIKNEAKVLLTRMNEDKLFVIVNS